MFDEPHWDATNETLIAVARERSGKMMIVNLVSGLLPF